MRKEDLLEAAFRVYLRNPRATVHEVAEEAGVSKSTIFYYFKNKCGLEKELMMYVIKKFSPWREDNDLESAIKSRFELMKRYPGLARMTYTIIDNLSKTDPEFIEELSKRSFERISKMLEREGFSNPKELAIILHAFIDGLAMYSMYIDLDLDLCSDLVLKAIRGLKNEV